MGKLKTVMAFIVRTFLFTIVFFISTQVLFAADPVSMTKRQGITKGYFYTETIADSATGKNVKIPPMGLDSSGVTVSLHAGSNTGKFQLSTSSDAAIQADTATWTDWTEGDTTGSLIMTVGSQVTGIRGVSVSGEIVIEIVY